MISEELLDDIEAQFKPPFKYDSFGQMIFDSQSNFVLDVRGWGYLERLGERRAISIQNGFGNLVVDLLNEKFGYRDSGNANQTKDLIAGRIRDEHRKHKNLEDWPKIAAAKIYSSLFKK